MLDGEERPDQIDPQDFHPIPDGLLEKRRHPAADAGIGVDRVDRAKCLKRARHRRLDRLLVAGVGDMGERHSALALDLSDRLVEPLGLAVDRQHARAFAREGDDARAPDPARRACDDRRPAAHPVHESSSRLKCAAPRWPGQFGGAAGVIPLVVPTLPRSA